MQNSQIKLSKSYNDLSLLKKKIEESKTYITIKETFLSAFYANPKWNIFLNLCIEY